MLWRQRTDVTSTSTSASSNGRARPWEPSKSALVRLAEPELADQAAVSPFPPIADYAFLSDCESSALIAPSGNVEWMCAPRFDSPSIFGAMLDRSAGAFRFGAAEIKVPAARRYLPGTNVLETSGGTPGGGWIIIRDALVIGPWYHETSFDHAQRRAPTDYKAEHSLLRTVRCVNGEVQLSLDCEPVFDYGTHRACWQFTDHGYHQGLASADGVDLQLRLTTDLRLGFEGSRALARTLIKEGETRFCALSWGEREPPFDYADAYARMVWTAHHWQHWLDGGDFPDHPWRQFLQRSAPAQAHYRHNDFRVRTVHMHDDESPNGHAHCLQLMLGTSQAVPVADGEAELRPPRWRLLDCHPSESLGPTKVQRLASALLLPTGYRHDRLFCLTLTYDWVETG